jgi:hypothetical protein
MLIHFVRRIPCFDGIEERWEDYRGYGFFEYLDWGPFSL